jgi:hypothetical protein
LPGPWCCCDFHQEPGALENALSHLQCILVARRTRYTPEAVSWAQYDILELLRVLKDLKTEELFSQARPLP